MEGKFNSPYPFDDSDVYKIMEGAAYLLAVKEDKALDMYMDSLIHLIGAAQEPDGYLYIPVLLAGIRNIRGLAVKDGKMNVTTAMNCIM